MKWIVVVMKAVGITAREAEADKDGVRDEERTDKGSNQPDPGDLNDSLASLSEYLQSKPQEQPVQSESITTERNLWLDLAVESIDSISPSLHMLD
ncbi:hypothetical protein PoB_003373800 [Plakobranchus ocellatus]|uniref:Uncharacterized protein n=1 Tax=Plakobranchus ocellatus TaxID=259542 RepID=A0AAV4AKD2_9GAST|nr:hypothetical protein PoB_003373800 [Plakobranchus ocellatus]